MDTPFLKIGVSYMNVNSIERWQHTSKTERVLVGESYQVVEKEGVKVYFKGGNSKGDKYWIYWDEDFEVISEMILKKSADWPEPSLDKVNRFEMMEIENAE